MIYIIDHSSTNLATHGVETDDMAEALVLPEGSTRILLREQGDLGLCLANGRMTTKLLLRVYNTLKGGKPAPKLQSKERAIASIWERLQKNPNAIESQVANVLSTAPEASEPVPATEKEASMATKKSKAKKAAKPKRIAARKEAAKSKGPRGEKTKDVARLLQRTRGCTRKEILEATGWPAVSVQAMAKNAGLKLKKEKEKGKPTHYFGTA